MTLEGELVVRVTWDGSRVREVDLVSTRPRVAGRVLVDRTPTETVAIVPRLFAICGRSQAVAAALACEAAAGRDADARALAARARLVRGEIVQEYLWRMLLDWPPLVGRAATPQALGDARRDIGAALAPDDAAATFASGSDSADKGGVLPDAVRATVQRHVLGEGEPWTALDDSSSGERWLARSAAVPAQVLAQMLAERPALGASGVPLLSPDSASVAATVGRALDSDPAFEQTPTWRDAPAETGALARMHRQPFVASVLNQGGRSVAARFLARVVELVGIARPDAVRDDARCGALATGRGAGLGWVETARGLLVHAVELAAGRVKRYRIVAPTEWNFHPRGALAAGLVDVPALREPDVRRIAELVVQSLDPCVAARVEVIHA